MDFVYKFLAFVGPGFMVSVGYLDPGNWATDLAAGSQFGYKLLFVIFISNLMAILLQSLCIRLGIVTKLDLAQHCSLYFSKHVGMALYVLAEVGIIAMDLAEVIGSAIALKLLLGIPILYGVLITSLDVMVILLLWSSKETRPFEILIFVLVMSVAICLFVIVGLSGVDFSKVALGFLPPTEIISNPNALLITIGIIGATGFNFITLVMPHNLYLHSNLVIRKAEQSQNIKDKSNYYKVVRTMLNLSYMDSAVALMFALFVNAAILIVSAANFNSKGRFDIADLEDAYYLMQSTLGSSASTLFAVALLLAGQSSTITGTLAGQIVMEAFLPNLKLRPWMRRLVTRSLAIVPAIVTIFIYGDQGLTNLLIYSQVVLSLQLPFAVWPLVFFTCNKKIMSMGSYQVDDYILSSTRTVSPLQADVFPVSKLGVSGNLNGESSNDGVDTMISSICYNTENGPSGSDGNLQNDPVVDDYGDQFVSNLPTIILSCLVALLITFLNLYLVVSVLVGL